MDIASATYVSLVSYKRDGAAVPVPVWIAPLADGRAGFTTDGGSFKVKRIRRNPKVVLQACDMRGRVADGADEVPATAVVVTEGADLDAVVSAIGKKYGIQAFVLSIGTKLKSLVGKAERTAIVITFDAPA
ncbi:PPOX class F420-dependent oxidoreductase [Aquihabitans sp. McL0605]|uniref:PPOX class F420-dependent oxidoreductase n=1 Tax=Aquihabitans sp. McL0605 TaxID=3415671 RepID=UPI003CF9B809